jgi:hypothetical protein
MVNRVNTIRRSERAGAGTHRKRANSLDLLEKTKKPRRHNPSPDVSSSLPLLVQEDDIVENGIVEERVDEDVEEEEEEEGLLQVDEDLEEEEAIKEPDWHGS